MHAIRPRHPLRFTLAVWSLLHMATLGLAQDLEFREIADFKGELAVIGGASAMSRDAKFVASAGLVKGISIRTVDKPGEPKSIPNKSVVRSLVFSPDGKKLAIGGEDGTVRIVSVTTGKDLARTTGRLDWPPR